MVNLSNDWYEHMKWEIWSNMQGLLILIWHEWELYKMLSNIHIMSWQKKKKHRDHILWLSYVICEYVGPANNLWFSCIIQLILMYLQVHGPLPWAQNHIVFHFWVVNNWTIIRYPPVHSGQSGAKHWFFVPL